jgi:hypothetical protein
VTLFGIFLTPVFFFVLTRFGSRTQGDTAPVPQPAASPVGTAGTSRDLAKGSRRRLGRPAGWTTGPWGTHGFRPAETVATGRNQPRLSRQGEVAAMQGVLRVPVDLVMPGSGITLPPDSVGHWKNSYPVG